MSDGNLEKKRGTRRKGQSQKPGKENISAKRKTDSNVGKNWQVKEDEGGVLLEKVVSKTQFHCSAGGRRLM